MIQEHRETFSDSQIDTLVQMNSRPLRQLFFECPFCAGLPDDLKPKEQDNKNKPDMLPKHIAGHLKEIALWSLPPAEARSSSDGTIVTGRGADSSRDDDFDNERLGLMIPPPEGERNTGDDELPDEAGFPSPLSTCGDGSSHFPAANTGESERSASWEYLTGTQGHSLPFDDPKLSSFVDGTMKKMDVFDRKVFTVLQSLTLVNPYGEPYVRVSRLMTQLKNVADTTGHPLFTPGKDPLVHCIVYLLNGEFNVANFWGKFLNLMDHQLPVNRANINLFSAHQRLRDQFYELQWRFCPANFTYFESDTNNELVRPIYRQDRIKRKGGLAELSRIEVLEDFVDPMIREEAKCSKFKSPKEEAEASYLVTLNTHCGEVSIKT